MSQFDWDRIRRGKELQRDRLANVPFPEKLLMLERLRERAQALSGSRYPSRAETTSNVHIVVTPSQQVGWGKIQIGVFGANATSTTAATRAESSSRATTTTVGQTK